MNLSSCLTPALGVVLGDALAVGIGCAKHGLGGTGSAAQ